MWFAAENVRPPFEGDWSAFLSFETDSLQGRNAYLPLWLLDLADFNDFGDLRLQDLLTTRAADPDREGFACAFIGNPEPMRLHAVNQLSQIGPVDVFGRAVGRPVPSRAQVARSYRYVLCFENDVYPGYVTEKVLEGARTGCVPLYRGGDLDGIFNRDARIDCTPPQSLQDLVMEVTRLEACYEERVQMLTSPVLRTRPSLDEAVSLIRRVLDE